MSTFPEFSVEDRAEQPYVGVSGAVTMDHFAPVVDRLPEILGWLAGQGVAPAGAPFLRYRVIDMERELLVQAGVPLAQPLADTAPGLETDVLPAGRYVTTTYTGSPDHLIEVTRQLLEWARQQGLTFDQHPSDRGDVWGCRLEIFQTNPMEVPDTAHWVTTLAFRLAS